MLISSIAGHRESATDAPKAAVYAFAHRVNQLKQIPIALNSGANGIEMDICEHDGSWYVGHDSPCYYKGVTTLFEYLSKLKSHLKSSVKHRSTFCMLWIDIKDKNSDELETLPTVVHSAGLPSTIYIIYDINYARRAAYSRLGMNSLYENELVSARSHKLGISVAEIHEEFSKQKFTRATYNDVVNHEFELAAANGLRQNTAVPFGFVLVFSYTLNSTETMEKVLNPKGNIFTEGVIVGDGNTTAYVQRFFNAMENVNGISKKNLQLQYGTPRDKLGQLRNSRKWFEEYRLAQIKRANREKKLARRNQGFFAIFGAFLTFAALVCAFFRYKNAKHLFPQLSTLTHTYMRVPDTDPNPDTRFEGKNSMSKSTVASNRKNRIDDEDPNGEFEVN